MPASGGLRGKTGRPVSAAAVSTATACASEWTINAGGALPLVQEPLMQGAEMGGDLDHPVREAPFVIVPRHDADEGFVEHLGLGHVEGRAMRIVVEIDRHGRRLVDAENAAQPVRCGCLL